MENYEQKYKEAMSFLKDLRPHMSDYCKEKIDGFFPELRESEDEKTRKAILELVKQSSHILNPMNQKSMIAWLEKQGEQKPAWSEEDEKILLSIIEEIRPFGECPDYPTDEDREYYYNRAKMIDWLKSIKPNHWKPSGYDISLLEEIAINIRNNVRPFCSEVSALEDLIENLKNL